MNVEIGRQDRNNEVVQFHFCEYVHKSGPDIYIVFSPALHLHGEIVADKKKRTP